MNNLPQQLQKQTNDIVSIVKDTQIISTEDAKFLSENVENFKNIIEHTYMWRTKGQKLSIISNEFFPTIHSKFHQCILETKVQFNELFRLSVDAEKAKLKVEKISIDIEEIQNKLTKELNEFKNKKLEIKLKEKELDLRQKAAELSNFQTAASYRMKELKQWKEIQDDLYNKMKQNNYTDEQIWNKEAEELEDQFYLFLNKLNGIEQSTNAAEVSNLTGLAKFAIEQAKQSGNFERLVNKCNQEQLETLEKLGYITLSKFN